MPRGYWVIAVLLLTAVVSEPTAEEDATVEDAPSEKLDVNVPGFDQKLPTPGELLKMLDSMDLSDEEKENIRENILKNAESLDSVGGTGFLYQALILVGLLSVLALIFGFFGYKLYKSLIARDIKREMKRKQKEDKKKKK